MMQQYQQMKQAYPEALLLFRMGDFYELFFEDAVVAARQLEITLTSRSRDKNGIPVPMCGVPYHAVNSYIARLVRNGHRVAICEQVEDPRDAAGIVRREVIRVVTPGTTTDDLLLEPKSHHYLAAVHFSDQHMGLAIVDLSTGHLVLSDPTGPNIEEQALSFLASFSPAEVLVPESLRTRFLHWTKPISLASVTGAPDWTFHADLAQRVLREQFKVTTLDGFGIPPEGLAITAAGGLIEYLRRTQKSALDHICTPSYLHASDFLRMDASSVANLELVQSVDGLSRWTLFSVLDGTQTGMGARLLKEWMLRPSLSIELIRQRQDALQELKDDLILRHGTAELLSKIHDMERLLSKAILGIANPRDLATLGASLKRLPELKAALSQGRCEPLRRLHTTIDPLEDVAQMLDSAIMEEPPISIQEGGIIRDRFNPELDELRSIQRDGKSYIAAMENRERARTRIPSLKIKYNRVFGYFIEVTRPHLRLIPDDYSRRQTLANAERFVTPELKEYEEKVLTAEERMLELEKELFISLRNQVVAQHLRVQASAAAVAEIDVFASLADVAHRHHYCRPVVDDSTVIDIRNGRHAVLEQRDDQPFTPNDLYADNETHQILLITGPNMGGKSTFLRQNALIVILAQMGSFVPADSARIGLVDQIFTRVGASDNLARGRSTFMVEMIETANILNNATPRSLILLDEVGRGTATFDGLSIAWAVAEFLHNESERKAKTLFATHYHELTKLERLYTGVKNFCVTARESGDNIVFFHKLVLGNADKSYGIEVARLAGLPQPVLCRAREILKRLERKEIDLSGQPRARSTDEVTAEIQKSLF
ncbi:MAG: DNA mismatch repair protein MutS [Acidobacteria bacterium]|nr:DNA mismatch repair protein MutS [Acidobacteriota bacterium]